MSISEEKGLLKPAVDEELRKRGIDDLQLTIDICEKVIAIFNRTRPMGNDIDRLRNISKKYGVDTGYGIDVSPYPPDVQDTIYLVCAMWDLIPPLMSKDGKSPSAQWIRDARWLIDSCGADGLDVIKEYHKDWLMQKDEKGVEPFTVCGPGSLLNVVRAKAAKLRQIPKEQETMKIGADGGFFL